MIGDLAGAANSLGRRFTFTGILPLFLLGLYICFLAVVASTGPSESILQAIDEIASSTTPKQWGALVAAALVAAVVMEPFQIAVVRLLEGYWGSARTAGRLRDLGAELQRRKVERLRMEYDFATDEADIERALAIKTRLAMYPPDQQQYLPTRLGNTLRAGELTAGERYGLATLVTWPRIMAVIGPELRDAVSELHRQVDGGSRLAFVFGLASASSLPGLMVRGWWNLLTLGLAMLAWLSYSGAVNAATRLRLILNTAYDLHRFDLLTALHLPLPPGPVQETAANLHLSRFLAGNADSPLLSEAQYAHPS